MDESMSPMSDASLSAGEILLRLTASATLAAGALLYGAGSATLSTLALGTAGRVLVAGASAPAWSDAGLSYASGVLAIAGSAPGTPSAGQVLIGGGAIKAGGSITGASLTSGASVYVSNTNGISLSDNAVGGSIGYGYNSGRTNPASHIWYNGISTQTMSLSAAGVLTTLAGISCATLTANDAGAGPQLTAQGSVQGSVNILKTGAYGFQIYSNAVNSLQFYDNQAAYAPFSIYGGTPGTPGSTNVFVGNGQIKAGAAISCAGLTSTDTIFSSNGTVQTIMSYGATYGTIGTNSAHDLYLIRGGSQKATLTASAFNLSSGVVLQINGTQVVGAQGAAIADATDAASTMARLNDLLGSCRSHGLIAT